MLLLLTYECFDKNKDMSKLNDFLSSHYNWWHHLDNVWIIEADETPMSLYDKIRLFFVKQDHIFVTEIKNNTFGWMPEDAWQWLSTRSKFQN